MAHRCIECKNIIESGSIDLASGCPVCGCKKFQYIKPHKKEAKGEADLRKLTVIEYVARAAASEAKPEVPEQRGKEPTRTPKALKIEVKQDAGPRAKDVAKETAAKSAHSEKKPHPERIESVSILEKGRYDLNLPMLLNRKELVMSREEGVYVVDLPSALKTTKPKKQRKNR